MASSEAMNSIIVTDHVGYSGEVPLADIIKLSKPLQIISVTGTIKRDNNSIAEMSTSVDDCSLAHCTSIAMVAEYAEAPKNVSEERKILLRFQMLLSKI